MCVERETQQIALINFPKLETLEKTNLKRSTYKLTKTEYNAHV